MKLLSRMPCDSYYDVAAEIAYNLYKGGVTKVRPYCNFTAGHEDIEHISLWFNNIECSPYIPIETPRGTMPKNLLWEILKEFKISYGGGASKDGNFMQASWSKGTGDYRVKHIDPSKLISDICLYHQAFMDFPNVCS